MLRLTIVAALASLVVAGSASAGGWATAGVSPPPPDDPSGGSTWNTDITIRQHGITPLDDVSPAVILRNTATGEEQEFPATPTGEPGTYAAQVVFPDSGRWAVEVYDGFVEYGGATRHTFGVVALDGPAAAPGSSAFPLAWTLAGVGAAVALVGALVLFLRRRTSAPAPAPSA
jgi:hypothetical protein